MLIQCLIERNGPTEVSHAGMNYNFRPQPDLTGNDKDNVCEVCSSHAIDRFLNDTGGLYAEWKRQDNPAPVTAEPKKQQPVVRPPKTPPPAAATAKTSSLPEPDLDEIL